MVVTTQTKMIPITNEDELAARLVYLSDGFLTQEGNQWRIIHTDQTTKTRYYLQLGNPDDSSTFGKIFTFSCWSVEDDDKFRREYKIIQYSPDVWAYLNPPTSLKMPTESLICGQAVNDAINAIYRKFYRQTGQSPPESDQMVEKISEQKDDAQTEVNGKVDDPDDNCDDASPPARAGFLEDLKRMESQKEQAFQAEHDRRVAQLIENSAQPEVTSTEPVMGERPTVEGETTDQPAADDQPFEKTHLPPKGPVHDRNWVCHTMFNSLKAKGLISDQTEWKDVAAVFAWYLGARIDQHVKYCLNQQGKQQFYRLLTRHQVGHSGMLRTWIGQLTVQNQEKGQNLKQAVQDLMKDHGRDQVKAWWEEYCSQEEIDF